MLVRWIFALMLLSPLPGAASAWLENFETWRDPDEEAWLLTTTLGDSDDDAIYSLHRAWRRSLGDGRWLLGWEVGLGAADSGKYGRTGALGSLDLVVHRRVLTLGPALLRVGGAAGLQAHTIRFPGGSHYNGRLGAFFDLGWDVGADRRLEARLGYLHVSNANLGSGNEGIDAIWTGLGLRW